MVCMIWLWFKNQETDMFKAENPLDCGDLLRNGGWWEMGVFDPETLLSFRWHAKGGIIKGGIAEKRFLHIFARLCAILRFSAGHLGRKKRAETHKKAQKRAKMHKNTLLCTDACNTPVYYTPVSVHPLFIGDFDPCLFYRTTFGHWNDRVRICTETF